MDRMRNVDGHVGWYKDPMHDLYKTKDDAYAITHLLHDDSYHTYIADGVSPKGVKIYSKHCIFNTLEDAIQWCETHRAVGA